MSEITEAAFTNHSRQEQLKAFERLLDVLDELREKMSVGP